MKSTAQGFHWEVFSWRALCEGLDEHALHPSSKLVDTVWIYTILYNSVTDGVVGCHVPCTSFNRWEASADCVLHTLSGES